MQVCPTRMPIEVRTEAGHRVECWLHGPEDQIPDGGRERLEQEEIDVAEEA
jgi:hypothetical protein